MRNMWSKKRRTRQKEALKKLTYLHWHEEHYEETADYALDWIWNYWNNPDED